MLQGSTRSFFIGGLDLEILKEIREVDKKYLAKSREEWDKIAHPLGSLGQLEEVYIQISAIQEKDLVDIEKRALIVMCGDNGITEENVSSGYDLLTSQLVDSMANKFTAASALCRSADMDLYIVDLGTRRESEIESVIKRRHRPSTSNFMKEEAMTEEETQDCINFGIEMVKDLKEKGYSLIGTGELGIANTTTSSAVMAALQRKTGRETAGLGAGINDQQLENKIRVIDQAIEKYELYKKSPLEILRAVGGYDIAGLVGVFIGAGVYRMPVLIDGFISAVAALIAVRMCPEIKGYLIGSHLSREQAVSMMFDELGIKPVLNLDMRLGEGTGCAVMVKIIDSAISCYKHMGRFEDNGVDHAKLFNIRED